jgi:CRISPR-associated protein Cas1
VQYLNTLYVTTADSRLRLENDTLRVEVEEDTRLRVPLHHLQSVVCFGHVAISSPLMHRLADAGIALVLLDAHGRYKARLEGATSGNVLLRRAQHCASEDAAATIQLARTFAAGKIRNQRHVVQRGAREAKDEEDRAFLIRAALDLAASLRALPEKESLDEIRGVEGEAARTYFEGLNRLVRRDLRDMFTMNGRTRRPPRDRMNAVLSFLYSMWMNDCRSACESVGLDPQIGFLHALRPGRAALALDLLEEFRPVADRLALTLINRSQLAVDSFDEREGGAVLLNDIGRRTVITAFQERKSEEVTHALLSSSISIGLIPLVQARLVARHLRGDTAAYSPFRMR